MGASFEKTLQHISFLTNGCSPYPLIETHCHFGYSLSNAS